MLASPDVAAFEVGLASRFLGTAGDGAGSRLYRVRVATTYRRTYRGPAAHSM